MEALNYEGKLPKFITDSPALYRAFWFAHLAHSKRTEDGKPQVRKFSGKPYVVHPIAVASILRANGADQNMIIAGLLHDTVEDTLVEIDEIVDYFGEDIAYLVEGMTKKSMGSPENRAHRKAMDRDAYATYCERVQTIKVADIIHNSRTIPYKNKNGFAKLWLGEAEELLAALLLAKEDLRNWAIEIVESRLELLRA